RTRTGASRADRRRGCRAGDPHRARRAPVRPRPRGGARAVRGDPAGGARRGAGRDRGRPVSAPRPEAAGDVVRPTFRAFVTRRFGDEARAWLARLPELEGELAGRWRLTLGPELHGGRLASVRLCRRADGAEAVLKLVGTWDRPE